MNSGPAIRSRRRNSLRVVIVTSEASDNQYESNQYTNVPAPGEKPRNLEARGGKLLRATIEKFQQLQELRIPL